MAVTLLWIGLTFILALTPALQTFGLHPREGVIETIGAVFMFIGCILLLLGGRVHWGGKNP